jgi:hypothetical protein
MNTPLLFTYARPMNYRAAGVPVPSSVAVRVEPGVSGVRFYWTPVTAASPDADVRVELELRASDYRWAANTSGLGTVWAVNFNGSFPTTRDRVTVGDGETSLVFGADGKFHEQETSGWVAPVAIVGGVALVAAIVVAARK